MGLFGFGKKKEMPAPSTIPELDLPPLPPANFQSSDSPQMQNMPTFDIPPLELPELDMSKMPTAPLANIPPLPQQTMPTSQQTSDIPSLDNLKLDFDLSLPDIEEPQEAPVTTTAAPAAQSTQIELPPAPEFVGDKFLKIDSFKEVVAVTHTARTEIDECITIGSAMNNVQDHQMKSLERFQNEILNLHRKISNMDRLIFER